MIAEVLYPPRAESGIAIVGAWVSGLKEIHCDQLRGLYGNLPGAQISPDKNGLKIEIELVSPTLATITRKADVVAAAISRAMGTRAGFCPVSCNKDVLRVTRAG